MTLNIPRLLIKWRVTLFILMSVLVVGSVCLVPFINVNTDMTRYLLDDSPMKIGMDVVAQDSPELDEEIHSMGASFGSGEDLMPKELPKALIVGVSLALLVLLLMCPSLMDVLLIMVSIGFAVILNMGTNALLPSVSVMTNSISSVLQMVLSMDYSIILVNRFRQEKAFGKGASEALESAVAGASSSILSSAFTTVVSLLMLVFIKIKIGADLGFVLAKGVGFSLICNFAVMPALIVWADRHLSRKGRKIPALPAASLARFETRFRYPLAVLALAVFVLSAIFQSRTPISFEPTWSSTATDTRDDANPLMLIYDTADAGEVPALLDSISTSPGVKGTFSWPSVPGKACTVEQMQDLLTGDMLRGMLDGGFAEMPAASDVEVPDFDASALASLDSLAESGFLSDMLRMLYYARMHPEGGGRLSFDELMDAASSLSAAGLVPAEYDMNAMMERMFAASGAEVPAPEQPEPVAVAVVPDSLIADAVLPPSDSLEIAVAPNVADSLEVVPAVDTAVVATADSVAPSAPVKMDEKTLRKIMTSGEVPAEYADMMQMDRKLTYEEAVTPLTADEMVEFLGIDTDMMPMLYRMAGKARQKMSPYELSLFVKNKLFKGPYARLVPAAAKEEFLRRQAELEEVYLAGPTPVTADTSAVVLVATVENLADCTLVADAVVVDGPVDSLDAVVVPADSIFAVAVADEVEVTPEETVPPTPMEILAEMAFSGRRYTADRVQRALSAAGIPVSQDEMDLMYIYALSRRDFDPSWTATPEELLSYVADSLMTRPAVAQFAGGFADMATGARDGLAVARKLLCGDKISAAIVITEYPYEGSETFAFIDRVRDLADEILPGEHYWIGESEMYKELKDSFPGELLLLTLLTVFSIFLIVAVDFRSLFVPIPLIMVIMSGVYINVIASGLGGQELYYMAYLIVQGILMGATIDYSILFTNVYRTARQEGNVAFALEAAYRGASHSILSSGLILSIVPFMMYVVMEDPMISSVVKSLGIGAFSALLLILFVLPGLLAALDPLICRKPRS